MDRKPGQATQPSRTSQPHGPAQPHVPATRLGRTENNRGRHRQGDDDSGRVSDA